MAARMAMAEGEDRKIEAQKVVMEMSEQEQSEIGSEHFWQVMGEYTKVKRASEGLTATLTAAALEFLEAEARHQQVKRKGELRNLQGTAARLCAEQAQLKC